MVDSLRLTRVSSTARFGTFGVLTINGFPFCVTLEPGDQDNQRNISSIPEGQYICKRNKSPKYGNGWAVSDVPNRDNILFHAGNTLKNTEGCIILAQHFGKLGADLAVLNSGETYKRFLQITENCPELNLVIVNCY